MVLSDELAARERRTLGVFALMLGAGLLLDHGPVGLGMTLLGAGLILFVWGLRVVHRATTASPVTPSETTQ
jgi:hypothetical protein